MTGVFRPKVFLSTKKYHPPMLKIRLQIAKSSILYMFDENPGSALPVCASRNIVVGASIVRIMLFVSLVILLIWRLFLFPANIYKLYSTPC